MFWFVPDRRTKKRYFRYMNIEDNPKFIIIFGFFNYNKKTRLKLLTLGIQKKIHLPERVKKKELSLIICLVYWYRHRKPFYTTTWSFVSFDTGDTRRHHYSSTSRGDTFQSQHPTASPLTPRSRFQCERRHPRLEFEYPPFLSVSWRRLLNKTKKIDGCPRVKKLIR